MRFGSEVLTLSLKGISIFSDWMYLSPMKRSAAFLLLMLLAAGVVAASAQVIPTATARQVSITVGGMASIFQPDFVDNQTGWVCVGPDCSVDGVGDYYPVAQASSKKLFGVGAYVDVKLSRWVQLEAEGRWLRFHQLNQVSQDNYLIGPRLPVYRMGKATVYAKALGGYSKMTFDPFGDYGKFTDLAFGGGVDLKLTKRLSLRAADFEYQYYPKWGNSTLSPYGVSMGFGYKIF
jgi:hypothetical protein